MYKPKRKVNKVFIHCSANDNEDYYGDYLRKEVHKWHVEEKGWDDIGYHFLIDKLGRVLKGRPLEKTPAAQKGHNTGTIAIMVHGYRSFTGESMNALRRLCRAINEEYRGEITFHGHSEVDPGRECPCFNYKTILALDDEGYMLDEAEGPKE